MIGDEAAAQRVNHGGLFGGLAAQSASRSVTIQYGIEREALEMALRTPDLTGAEQVITAARKYRAFMRGEDQNGNAA